MGNWVWVVLVVARILFAGLVILGIFLPVLPPTSFLLLAMACYARSSPRFHHWLLNNRWFGGYISNYPQGRGISIWLKILTLALLWLTIECSVAFAVQIFPVRIILELIYVGVTATFFPFTS